MEAVDRCGVLRGVLMAAWRVLRCHPFAKGGYDPVLKPGPLALRLGRKDNDCNQVSALKDAR
jgi:putative component of membrane protein insertase Oxa1/YidC/SpoIIIJ protein YidD